MISYSSKYPSVKLYQLQFKGFVFFYFLDLFEEIQIMVKFDLVGTRVCSIPVNAFARIVLGRVAIQVSQT